MAQEKGNNGSTAQLTPTRPRSSLVAKRQGLRNAILEMGFLRGEPKRKQDKQSGMSSAFRGRFNDARRARCDA